PVAERVGDRPKEIDDRTRLPSGDVDGLAREVRRLRGEDVGFDHVRDVREVSRLPAVVVDFWGFATDVGHDKPRDRRGVRRTRILTWPKYVEIPETHGAHAVEIRIDADVALSRELCDRVRGPRKR